MEQSGDLNLASSFDLESRSYFLGESSPIRRTRMFYLTSRFNDMFLSELLAPSPMHHPLAEHEIREMRLLVKQYQLEIEVCNERIEELLSQSSGSTNAEATADFEALTNETINQKETLERLLVEKSALISLIRHLPSELLALVMTCHVRENGQSPWTLLAVSKSWRYLGLETPRIWSSIHIIQRPKSPFKYAHTTHSPGGVICRNEEMWKIALTRSGAVLLDMIIQYDLSLMPRASFNKLVLESGHRWRSVVYDVIEAGQQWSVDWASTLFPNLQSMAFLRNCTGGTITDGLLSVIESTSLKMRSMVLQSSVLEASLGARSSLLQRIKEMDFTPQPLVATLSGLGDVIWSRLPRIEILVLRDVNGSTILSRKDNRFTTLRVFAAKTFAIPVLADYSSQLKSLTHVYLDIPSYQNISGPLGLKIHSIALVNVTHFGFVSSSYTPLHWFHLPSLILLELFGNTMPTTLANEEFDLIWNLETPGKAPSPIVLHAEVKANDAYLLMALRSMDRVKDLCLYYDTPQTASKFMGSLAVKPKKSVVARGEQAIKKWVPPTCPELETLSMIYKRLSKQDRVDINQKLQHIQDARMGTAREMKELRALLRSEHTYQTSNMGQQFMEQGPYWT